MLLAILVDRRVAFEADVKEASCLLDMVIVFGVSRLELGLDLMSAVERTLLVTMLWEEAGEEPEVWDIAELISRGLKTLACVMCRQFHINSDTTPEKRCILLD